jgi:hypothetical protein
MSNSSSKSTTTEEKIDQIVEAIDESTMLGAAWDCLSDTAKGRFKKKLALILDESLQSEVTDK